MDGTKGTKLWNIVKEAGASHGIGPGNPNLCERIESGLLSYGGDSDETTNPFEVRMGKYVDLDLPDDVIGIAALKQLHASGIKRQQLGVVLEGTTPKPFGFTWKRVSQGGADIGAMTCGVWSYRLKQNIGFALVSSTCRAGDHVLVDHGGMHCAATLTELPFF